LSGPEQRAAPRAGAALGRRGFLEMAALAIGAAVSGLLAPVVARAQAGNAHRPGQVASDAGGAPPAVVDEQAEWHIDDMWGHRPRYAHVIPHAPASGAPLDWSRIDPIDRNFIG